MVAFFHSQNKPIEEKIFYHGQLNSCLKITSPDLFVKVIAQFLPDNIRQFGAPEQVGNCVIVPHIELVVQWAAEADTDEIGQEHCENDD